MPVMPGITYCFCFVHDREFPITLTLSCLLYHQKQSRTIESFVLPASLSVTFVYTRIHLDKQENSIYLVLCDVFIFSSSTDHYYMYMTSPVPPHKM